MIGWSQFARDQHQPFSGNSFTLTLSEQDIVRLVDNGWMDRKPGQGEIGLNRKVVVPISSTQAGNFYVPFTELRPDLPVKARVAQRQSGEDYYIETYVDFDDAERLGIKLKVAKSVNVVCYSADALLENGGTRSTQCEWEIVAVLASESEDNEPMAPLTMSRNYLVKPGGTFTDYSTREFAEAIYHQSTHRGVKIIKVAK